PFAAWASGTGASLSHCRPDDQPDLSEPQRVRGCCGSDNWCGAHRRSSTNDCRVVVAASANRAACAPVAATTTSPAPSSEPPSCAGTASTVSADATTRVDGALDWAAPPSPPVPRASTTSPGRVSEA